MTDVKQTWLRLATEDSSRFNRRIVRGRIDGMPPPRGALAAEIVDLQADIAIIRLPAGMTAPIHDLTEGGFVPMHADTLVCHARPLDTLIIDKSRNSGFVAGLASLADRTRISEIARHAFRSYRSHYHANPLLDPAAITEGYVEWATAFLNAQAADRETWVVRQNDTILGFATCSLSGNDNSAEIVLNAVDPAHAGRGAYGHLLNHMLLNYQTRGFTVVGISTQVWNYTVQRAWARAGFVIRRAYDTYHINTLANWPENALT